MALTRLNIPVKINVGFRNRKDTYTGMLAYVVYYDQKGKLRKEKSWDGWRDHKIKAQEFENEPTEGFVLNKKIGGQNWGWHSRQTKVRVYDPRGFEFEIGVENLLFILEECSAIKGKGLEGEFVYAWEKADLILLPVTSQEYAASQKHTAMQTKKLTKDDMKPGCLYRTKSGEEVMYLGRHPWHYTSYKHTQVEVPNKSDRRGRRRGPYFRTETTTIQHDAKKHIFVSLDKRISTWVHFGKSYDKHHYWVQTGYTKIGERLTEDPSPKYADEFDKFKKSKYGSGKAKAKPKVKMQKKK